MPHKYKEKNCPQKIWKNFQIKFSDGFKGE